VGKKTEQEDKFRLALKKIMPGYQWTIKKSSHPDYIVAEGIQSSGFNRLSSLDIARIISRDGVYYLSKLYGFGRRATLIAENKDTTLARSLRNLQAHCEGQEQKWRAAVSYLKQGRTQEVRRG